MIIPASSIQTAGVSVVKSFKVLGLIFLVHAKNMSTKKNKEKKRIKNMG